MRVAHVCTVDLSLRYLLGNQMQHLQRAGFDVIGISTPGPHVPWLEQHGIRHVPVPMQRAFTPLDDLRAVADLARVMRREKLTIVHTHNAKPGLLGQLAARLAGVPIVVNTIHGYYFQDDTPLLKRRFYVLLEQVAASCSDDILSQSKEDLETAVREHICARGDIEHLGNGIDVTRFDPTSPDADRARARASLGLAPDQLVLGFVGRLVEEKGVRELWAAVHELRARFPRIRLVIVGETDRLKGDALGQPDAKAAGVDDLCVFTGWRDDLPSLYAAMDVCVLPSWREGFPRVPMEASAMGIPVVATDIRGCREAVEHGVNGVLVPAKDAGALTRALEALLSDEGARHRLGDGGRRLARERFDERRIFATVERHYRELLAKKGIV
ncbi:MAG: glycosyl transferase family 1 [Deltaproteobacteria bacterium RBG_16_71_12]|nr:MAG: glycosyl transferase family 1 [Deltaproteobacteria bacterium RBG_16_71_12]